jgi:hypothetical protein
MFLVLYREWSLMVPVIPDARSRSVASLPPLSPPHLTLAVALCRSPIIITPMARLSP